MSPVILTGAPWAGDPIAETVHALAGNSRSLVQHHHRSVPAGDTGCGVPAAGMSVLVDYDQARLYTTCRACFGERAPFEVVA